MYCINCGVPLSENAGFCSNCGARRSAPAPQQAGPQKTAPHKTAKRQTGGMIAIIATGLAVIILFEFVVGPMLKRANDPAGSVVNQVVETDTDIVSAKEPIAAVSYTHLTLPTIYSV